ncbi:MAG: CTP synthase [Candidatus Celerinatantimonas neptuna]|nr:MAG: CTP synthase [Candidatus Celerinatantimonas neptuna]
MKIALIGDFNEQVPAHQAILKALELAGCPDTGYQWIHTQDADLNTLASFSAFWCVPASPYADIDNVLTAIGYARTHDLPFLGTCGGYQHAVLEFARHALGYPQADNAEVNPDTSMPLVASLTCKLYDERHFIRLASGSLAQQIYGCDRIEEEYHCGFGVNPDYLSIFDGRELSFSGFDEDGDPRVLEIKSHCFFIGTAFQPERSAFSGKSHPLICRFVESAKKVSSGL